MSETNVKTIQTIYAAFGRGDVPGVLEHVADDVEFSFNVAKPVLPWHATFKGKGELPKFFAAIGAGTTVRAFRPETFVATGSHVVVDVHFDHVLKKNGRNVIERQVHWWTFDARGKVSRLVHYTDTAMLGEAASA
jgi:ketosteroid isomerase-like protein